MNNSPLNAIDVARWFVRILALAMIVVHVFYALEMLAQVLGASRSTPPAIFALYALGGLIFWGFIWLFSSGIGESLAFGVREQKDLSTKALRVLALPFFGFLVGAQGLAQWISRLMFALINAAISPGNRTPFDTFINELDKLQTRELLQYLPTVLQIGIGLFLAFILPRLRQPHFVDEA